MQEYNRIKSLVPSLQIESDKLLPVTKLECPPGLSSRRRARYPVTGPWQPGSPTPIFILLSTYKITTSQSFIISGR